MTAAASPPAAASAPSSASPPGAGLAAGPATAVPAVRRDRPAVIAVKYVLFAAIATGCNLGSQALMDRAYRGGLTIYASLFAGTLVGLVVKYLLDKRFIFYDSTSGAARRGRQFVRYALTGILTTAIFWGLELGANAAFQTHTARYVGGAVGLALGYWVKYQLDKRLVFGGAAGGSVAGGRGAPIGTTSGPGSGAPGGAPIGARSSAAGVIAAIALVRAARPKQWLKNLLVLAAPIAAGVITEGPVLARAAVAFVAFCLASSGLYLVNDVVDADCDRLHPVKCGRPVAAGLVSPRLALITAAVLLVIAEAAGVWLGYRFEIILTVYIGLVVSYTLWLKHYPIVDILVVAACFVLRAIAGSAATGVQDSGWFLLLVSLGALFVVAGKRYADLHAVSDLGARNGAAHNSGAPGGASGNNGASRYNGPFLLYLAFGLAAASVAAYVLWVFLSPASSLGVLIPLSIIPFAVAVGRYAYLVAGKRGGAPEDLFIKDGILKLAMLVWFLMYGGGIYVFS